MDSDWVSRRPGPLVVALLAASFLAACTGGSYQPTSPGSPAATRTVTGARPAPASRISPGHGTPQSAVEGEAQAEFQGNWLLACSYASPGTQQACLQGNADLGRESGRVIIDGADIAGDHALVELRGTVCNKVVGCVSNYYSNPSAGMPARPADFRAAYDAALPPHRTALTISPLPMVKVNGQWYINYS